MAYRSWPIKRKLLAINVGTVVAALAAVLLVAGIVGYVVGRDRLLVEKQLHARIVAAAISEALARGDFARIGGRLARLQSPAANVTGTAIFDETGTPLAWWPREAAGASLDVLLPRPPAVGGASHASAGSSLDVYEPIVSGQRLLGYVGTRSSLEQFNAGFAWHLWLGGSVALLIAGVALLVQERLLRRISVPLRTLATTMLRLAERPDLSARVSIAGDRDDEVGQLARGFNEMMANLRERDHQLGEELNERKRAERRLHDLAHYDALTGLPNRRHFNDSFARLLAQREAHGGQLALLFFDLDDFKIVNDSLGHAAGDDLIRGVGERVGRVLRAGDMLCRLGGDEFTITLPRIAGPDLAESLARRILDSLAQPFVLAGREVFAAASIGIAVAPADGRDAETLLRHADAAMYQAKGLGKNAFKFFSSEMTDLARRRLDVEASLRRALDRGELELHGQPQVDLGRGRVVGIEALLRWRHPVAGMLSPAGFLPVAEESGLIMPVGEWVLHTAAREARGWERAGAGDARVAVKLSIRQLRNPALADQVKQVLGDTRLDPRRLELEIDEAALADGDAAILDATRAIGSLGVRLAVDEFGCGSSSLSRLRKYPFATIKMHRDLIRGVPDVGDDVAITRAIVAMAGALELALVAEGVDNDRQHAFLASLGDMAGQGSRFGGPLPFEALRRFLEQGLQDAGSAPSPLRSQIALRVAGHD